MRTPVVWLAATCGLALGLLACLGRGVADEELPREPLAIHYRTPEEARKRAEALRAGLEERVQRGRQARRSLRYNALVPHLDQLERLVRAAAGRGRAAPADAGRLALLDPRSRSLRPIPGARRGAIPLDWSADHQRLLFAQPEGRLFQLWELRVSDGRSHPLTRGPLSHIQGCYAAGGRLVAVAARQTDAGVRSVVVRSEPGGRQPFVPLSRGPVDHSPACSPQGPHVAWVSEAQPGRPQIVVGALDDPDPARPVSPGRDPTWAPSADWLLWSAPAGRQWKLWRARGGVGGRIRMGRGGLDEFRPAVSPDGRFVAYVAGETVPRRHLYLRRFDGSGDRVLFADGDAEHPVW